MRVRGEGSTVRELGAVKTEPTSGRGKGFSTEGRGGVQGCAEQKRKITLPGIKRRGGGGGVGVGRRKGWKDAEIGKKKGGNQRTHGGGGNRCRILLTENWLGKNKSRFLP